MSFSQELPDNSRLLTEKEASALYKVSLGFLRKMRLIGGGPPYLKIGRMVRYRPADLQGFFDSHLVMSLVGENNSL